MDFKEHIIKVLKKETNLRDINLEIPPDPEMGDCAFPCFALSMELKKNPNEIAQDLCKKIKFDKVINKIEVKGPYLNFFVNKKNLSSKVLKDVFKEKNNFGKGKNKKRIMVEFSSPNTNKPLHLGHIRNNVLGDSLSRMLAFQGNKVIKASLVNDRGIHICKSMLAYQKWGKKENKKGDHLVGDYYILFTKKAKENLKLEEEAQDMLKKWEDGDKKLIQLWKKMNSWVLKGFDETYKKLGIKFDKTYYESKIYEKGKDIIKDALKKGLASKDEDDSIFIDLDKYNLGKKVLIRADGTAIYITQDIYLAKLKFDEYKLDKSIYVVGSEQDYHFNALFKTLEVLKYKWAKNCYHLSYGMVYLPSGRMKSREGTVVDADDLIDEMEKLALKEINKRYKNLSEKEKKQRAEKIGLGALKFYMAKHDSAKDMHYNPEESISFEGETGPYLQYTYARINSILKKYGKKADDNIKFELLKEEKEKELVKALGDFPNIIEKSSENLRPHILARYLLDLAQLFNNFYHNYPVLKAEEELKKARLLLISCVKEILKTGLNLFGIDVLEEM
ncbi:MAG: arginine--tRNA ligase [Nanoarchaeota archaeon]|nr:arginine--tRNA ligase [Nanoarchaeota archaeon]